VQAAWRAPAGRVMSPAPLSWFLSLAPLWGKLSGAAQDFDWRRLLQYAVPVRRLIGWSAGLSLAGPLITVSIIWLVKLLIDEVFVAQRFGEFAGLAVVYGGLVACKLANDYALERIDAATMEYIAQRTRTDFFAHIVSVSPGTLAKFDRGDLIARLTGDCERIEYLVFSGPLAILSCCVNIVFFFGFLLWLDWKLTLASVLIAPGILAATTRWSPPLKRASKLARAAMTRWLSQAEERLSARPIIQAFQTQASETASFETLASKARRAELRAVAIQAWLTLAIEAIAAVGSLVVLSVGAFEVSRHALTLGTFVAFLGSLGSLYGPVSSLAKVAGRLQRANASAERMLDIMNRESLVREPKGGARLPAAQGAVEFKDVHFTYPSGAKVLHGVSIRIPAGATFAIVGASGSGKSTLLKLLLRFFDPQAGAILIDGMDIRHLSLKSLSAIVAPVFQDPFLISGSFASNIRYGSPRASGAEVRTAARLARAEPFILQRDEGYAAPVGPRGSLISLGQQQRIALARALIRAAPILVLDEATASVDSETEELIQESIQQLRGRRTLLLVAHRLASVRRADYTLVLDRGRVVEAGEPDLLLQPGTHFRNLFAGQLEVRS
jgi:ATP-binding cassette subfamily B protein